MSWKSHIKHRTQPHFSEVPEAMLSEGSRWQKALL